MKKSINVMTQSLLELNFGFAVCTCTLVPRDKLEADAMSILRHIFASLIRSPRSYIKGRFLTLFVHVL